MSEHTLAQRAFFLKQFDASISHELVLRALDKLADLRDASFYFQKGEAHRLKNEIALAVSYYERALRIDPAHEYSLFYIALCYLGFSHRLTGECVEDDLTLSEQDRLNRSAFNFKKLINIREKRNEMSWELCIDYYNLGVVFRQMTRFNESLDCLYQALRIKDDYASAYDLLALVKSDMGLNEEALKDCLHAINLKQDPTFIDTRGLIQLRMGLFEDAIESFEITLEKKPHYVYPYLNLNYIYRQQKRFTEAFGILDRAIDLNADYPGFYYYYALTEDDSSDKEAAARYYREFLKRVSHTSIYFKEKVAFANQRLQELQKPIA